tara:strand:+ start:460 stop:705 length:246 start_codon:yes stop_codon:yes gene_type:complete
MNQDQIDEILDAMKRPHRIQNKFALHQKCADAAALIESLIAGAEEKAPKKSTSSKKKRARDEKGRLKADDPSTPEVNEAWD